MANGFYWPQGVPQEMHLPDQSIYDNLVQAARKWGARPAIVFQGRVMAYDDLHAQVRAIAGFLNLRGVGRGDRVILCMQNCPQFIIAYYAVLAANAVVVPVNPMSREAELRHLMADTGARCVIAGAELLPYVRAAKNTALETVLVSYYQDYADPDFDIPFPAAFAPSAKHALHPNEIPWGDALAMDLAAPEHVVGPNDLAVIPFSSGATGHPKGCMHSHRTVMATALGGVLWNPVNETAVHLITLPLFHVTGMQSSMNGPLMSGSALVILPRWNAEHAAMLIARYKITRWRNISTMAIDLLNHPKAAEFDLSSLEAIGGGGAAMPEAIARRLKERTGLDYIEGYGLSETMAATHINPIDAPRRQCLGVPVFDVDARVIDPDTLAELPRGEVGEIIMRGPQVFLGYWNNLDATLAAFVEIDGHSFFRSGDIGYVDADGYFYMVDRAKRMINASGFKVWPAEVEMLMLNHPDIAEACVVGIPDARRGEAVKAHVVLRAGSTTTEAEIINWCKSAMSAYKAPTQIALVDALPKSGSGKVLWRVIAEKEKGGT